MKQTTKEIVTISHILKQIIRTPLPIVLRKGFAKVVNIYKIPQQRKEALSQSTFSKIESVQSLRDFDFQVVWSEGLAPEQILNDILNHDFAILSDSTTNWSFSTDSSLSQHNCNPANREFISTIKSNLEASYIPIQWHYDVHSMHHWNSNTWFKDIAKSTLLGEDPKVPWELARFNHLAWLSTAINCTKNTIYVEEFQNQVLDFIASNPPQFGINWSSSMDVAMRIANCAFACCLVENYKQTFTPTFLTLLCSSIVDHCSHVLKNLEWSEGMRGNHYLANVCGVTVALSCTELTPQTAAWLRLCIEELMHEILFQFQEDGSNFEASIPYHRLSAEMVVWALAMIQSLDEGAIKKLNDASNNTEYSTLRKRYKRVRQLVTFSSTINFSETVVNRVYAIYDFTTQTCFNNGDIPSIGDDDSGRFLKIHPSWVHTNSIVQENHSDGTALLRSFRALVGECLPEDQLFLDTQIIQSLVTSKFPKRNKQLEHQTTFNNFGISVLKNSYFELIARAGSIGQNHKGGHSHNDQNSILLNVDNQPIFIDCGTASYTGNPALRDEFRSTAKHNTLCIEGKEQNSWKTGTLDSLFWISEHRTNASIIDATSTRWKGVHYGFGEAHKRSIEVNEKTIIGADSCNAEGTKWLNFHCSPLVELTAQTATSIQLQTKLCTLCLTVQGGAIHIVPSTFSPSYGVVQPTQTIKVTMDGNEITWLIKII